MYTWQVPCQAALLEFNPEKLMFKVEAAETAIFLRAQEFAGNSGHHAERIAMGDALRAIRTLQVDVPNFPEVAARSKSSQ